MSVMAEFSVLPVGKGESLSEVVARVLKIVSESGVSYRANPMGTVLEGSWDEVMHVIKQCHEEAIRMSGRVVTSVKLDDRAGAAPRMDKKLESVERKLGVKLRT